MNIFDTYFPIVLTLKASCKHIQHCDVCVTYCKDFFPVPDTSSLFTFSVSYPPASPSLRILLFHRVQAFLWLPDLPTYAHFSFPSLLDSFSLSVYLFQLGRTGTWSAAFPVGFICALHCKTVLSCLEISLIHVQLYLFFQQMFWVMRGFSSRICLVSCSFMLPTCSGSFCQLTTDRGHLS